MIQYLSWPGVGRRAVSYESRRTEKNRGTEEGENETGGTKGEARIGFSRLPKADVILSIEGAGTPGVTRISC